MSPGSYGRLLITWESNRRNSFYHFLKIQSVCFWLLFLSEWEGREEVKERRAAAPYSAPWLLALACFSPLLCSLCSPDRWMCLEIHTYSCCLWRPQLLRSPTHTSGTVKLRGERVTFVRAAIAMQIRGETKGKKKSSKPKILGIKFRWQNSCPLWILYGGLQWDVTARIYICSWCSFSGALICWQFFDVVLLGRLQPQQFGFRSPVTDKTGSATVFCCWEDVL